MILTIEKIRQFKEFWDADRYHRYLRGSGVNTFEDYLITVAHMPDVCSHCKMHGSLRSQGFFNFGGEYIKYECTWCYETMYVTKPA